MNMETLKTHRALALNMVAYWSDIRLGECAKRSPRREYKLIDEQIAKYEAQAKHLKEQMEAV